MWIKKKGSVLLLAAVLSAGMFTANVYAYSDENTMQNTVATAETSTVEEEANETADKEEQEIPTDALTPDGNLTLVDDVGDHADAGKQFITLVTRDGNYFYLIIDRDDEGEQTVHFLNQVDESDLLSLMDEEEAKQYQENQKPVEEPETIEPVTQNPTPELEKEEEKIIPNFLPAVVILIVMLAGGGIYLYVEMKKKKKGEQKPDPDADYEVEEYLELLDEEDSAEDTESDE